MNILYVEDDQRDIELIRSELSQAAPHFKLDVVSTQHAALARLEQQPGYDLVLTDLPLPDGDGIALLTHIRERALPVAMVIMTRSGDEETAVAALKAGADDYIVKRDDYLARLPLRLEQALRRYRAEAERHARPLRVLYAEDSAYDVDLTRRHLARHAPHIHLDTVGTASEVFRRLIEPGPIGDYDLLLLDYRLPGMDALALLKVLQELRQARPLELSVVLVTGQGDEEVALQALKLGAADYLVKNPGYLHRLPAVLENAFYRAQLAREHAALRESEARYRTLVESARDAIFTLSPDGAIVSLNPAFELLTGWSRAEWVGRPFIALVHADDAPLALRLFQRALHGETSSIFELGFRAKSGNDLVGEVLATLHIQDGQVVGVMGIARDVTDRKRAEEAIRKLNAELEQRVAERTHALAEANERLKELDWLKSKFVSDVSHELRTPVTNLKLYVELLERGDPEKRDQYMNILKDQAGRLAQLVEDILDLSRLELGADRVKFAPVDLNALVARVVVAHRPGAEAAGLALTFEPGADLPPVRGERNQLAQVVTNLVANALNYTPAGHVRVSTCLAAQRDQVCLQVEDTGVGIDAEDMPHFFDRFYRGKRMVKSDIPGSGLGLAIVKEIVDLHGGSIEVDSQVRQGSTFRVWLPVDPQL